MQRSTTLVSTASILSLLALAAPASAQNYTLSVSSGTFTSISGTGTPITLSNSDDGSGTILTSWAFNFFGTSVPSGTYLYVSSNGTVTIGTDFSGYTNVAIPTAGAPDGFLAPFWDDLNMASGSVYYATQGSAGSRTLVIEWSNASHYSATGDSVSFQARISESTGAIEYIYGTRVGGAGWSGTIGVETSDGSFGVSHTCGITAGCVLSDVSSGTRLVFTPSSTPPPQNADLYPYLTTSGIPSTVSSGQSFSVDFEVDNNGTGSSAATSIGLYAGPSSSVTTSDYLLATASVPAISASSYYLGTFNVTVPNITGSYYVAAIVDPSNLVAETNESNNVSTTGFFTVSGGGTVITVSTTSLPGATVNTFYSSQLQASGGTGSYYWSVISGTLPSGLVLGETGSLSGTPTVQGTSSFTVQATDFTNTPGTASLSIIVSPPGGNLQLTTTSLPNAVVGATYSAMLGASGGTPPYAFQIIQGKPEWLSVDGSGALSGTPGAAGSHDMLVSLFDASSNSTSGTVHLDVTMPTQLALNTALPGAMVDTPYDFAVVQGGIAPYTVSITSGTLPPGLTFNGAGHLAGSPSAPATARVGISVTDSDTPPGMVSGEITVTVTMRMGLTIVTDGTVTVYTNADTNQQLNAQGGVPPYTWTLVTGVLQSGLSLSSEGVLSGRVTRASTATVTLGVSDSMGAHVEREVLVKATAFRSMSGGSGNDRAGCSCSTERAPVGATSWGLLAAMAALFAFRPRFGTERPCRRRAANAGPRSSGPSGPPHAPRKSSRR